MSDALTLLDEALDLARQEKDALETGAYEEAIDLAEKRNEITGMAWNVAQPDEMQSYQERLQELSGMQNTLTQIAIRARSAIRERLNRSRKEKKRIQGYHLAVGQALQ